MRNDERTQLELHTLEEEAGENSIDPVVFDLSGTEKANVEDIAMILTARLQSAPTNQVWVHSIPSRTAHILKSLRLEHLFRLVPDNAGELN
jgi:hypothetical protein